MTPELLLSLGRVNPVGISKDSTAVVFTVSIPNIEDNKSNKKTYLIPIKGGDAKKINSGDDYVKSDRISPDGKFLFSGTPSMKFI